MREKLLKATIRNAIIIITLLALQFTIQFLPGIDRIVIQPNITIATLLYSMIALFIFGIIIKYATTVGTVLSERYNSIPNLDTIIQVTAVLIVLSWAYNIFWWIPFFQNSQSLYDLLFLIIGLILLSWLGYLLYAASDEIADILMDMSSPDTREENDDYGSSGEG